MATTLTMGYIDWPNLYVVHVGDTRCYHVRGESIEQMTTDHTLAQLARAATGESESPNSDQDTKPFNPMGHALWNVVGGHDHSLEPEVTKATLQVGDSLLLCSDGLTRYVDDPELLKLIRKDQTSEQTCAEMISIANDRGGKDNTTVVLAQFNEHSKKDKMAACNAMLVNSEAEKTTPVIEA